MTPILADFLFYGPPAILAAAPGALLFIARRPRLAAALTSGAILATFPLPMVLDRLRTEKLAERGVVADDLGFLFTPWVCAFWYFVFGLGVLGVCGALDGPERD